MSTVPIVYSPSQENWRPKIPGTSSMAAAVVTSLKIEPGGKAAERQRLIKAVSATAASPLMGSTEGRLTMASTSPVL